MSGLRQRMRSGEPLLGTFLDLGSALAADITAGAGFDWLVVDLEHGAGGREATLAQLQAARAPVIVRVPSADSEETGWVLDHGAAGRARPARAGHPRGRSRGGRHALRGGPRPRPRRARLGLRPRRGLRRARRRGARGDDPDRDPRGARRRRRHRAAARRRRAVRRPLRPRRRARRHARRRHAGGAAGGRPRGRGGARPGQGRRGLPRRPGARARLPRLGFTLISAGFTSTLLAGASDAILAALRP